MNERTTDQAPRRRWLMWLVAQSALATALSVWALGRQARRDFAALAAAILAQRAAT